MKRFLLIFALCLFAGCASFRNNIAHKGGLVSTRGDYVVISESGGVIMDVWVLEDVYVESEKNSDGWRFIDSRGNPTNVSGDIKVIRIQNKTQLKEYHEYHIEQSLIPYHGECLFSPVKQDSQLAGRYHLRRRVKSFFYRSRRVIA